MTPKTRGERLRAARKRLFRAAADAALEMGLPPATYGSHERAELPGGRDYGPDEAKRYARKFHVAPEWLLMGTGEGPSEEAADSSQEIEPVTYMSLIGALSVLDAVVEDRKAAMTSMLERIRQPKPGDVEGLKVVDGGLVPYTPEIAGEIAALIEDLDAAVARARSIHKSCTAHWTKSVQLK